MHYSLLLVEGESPATKSPYQYLVDNGHLISVTHNLRAASESLATLWPDLVILNLVGGEIDAVELNQAINRSNLNIPQLAVLEDTPPSGFQVEAVLQAPYTDEQLINQITLTIDHNRFQRWNDLVLDTHRKALLRTGVTHHLTPKLFDLFLLLVKSPGRIVYRKTIMKEVWETDYMGDTRTLDVHMRWLREKVEIDPSRPKHILTVRGAGYRFVGNLVE